MPVPAGPQTLPLAVKLFPLVSVIVSWQLLTDALAIVSACALADSAASAMCVHATIAMTAAPIRASVIDLNPMTKFPHKLIRNAWCRFVGGYLLFLMASAVIGYLAGFL